MLRSSPAWYVRTHLPSHRGNPRTEQSAHARALLLKERPATPGRFDRHRFREVTVALTPALSFRMLGFRAPERGAHWARVWPSSIALSRWLLERPSGWLADSAIELGCGLGLVSMTLAHLDVRVEATDRESSALLLVEENAELNGLPGVTTGLLDWEKPSTPGTSLLVSADALYEETSPPLLFTLIHREGLLLPGGTLVLADPRRRHQHLDELIGWLQDEAYAHEEIEDLTVDWEGSKDVIAIHVLRRPG